MDENMDRTPHSEDPAEGALDVDGTEAPSGGTVDAGDPTTIPEHDTAPDGQPASDGSNGGAIQGDASPDRETPLGGHETTEEQLDADNEVEEDTLKTLDPDNPPA